MIENDGDFLPVKDLFPAAAAEFPDGDRGGDIVAQHHIRGDGDELAGRHLGQTRVGGQYFLRHCHSQMRFLLIFMPAGLRPWPAYIRWNPGGPGSWPR